MRKLHLLCIFLLPAAFCRSQDVHFSQFSETPLLINPAITGLYDGYFRGIINYRSQWQSMGKPYSTFMGSFDMPLEMKKKKGSYIGTGLYFYSDRAGDSHFGTTQGDLSVSAILPASKTSKLSMGLQFGFAQHSWDLTSIQWPNQYNGMSYDPTIAPNETLNRNFTYFDMGVGGNYEILKTIGTIEGKDIFKFDLGASYFHPTSPLQKFDPNTSEHLYGKIMVYSSLRYDLPGTAFGVVPSCYYMMQGPASELDLGSLLRYKINQGTKVTGFSKESALSAGLSYRLKDAVTPQVYFEFSDYAFGISYDINVSTYTQNLKATNALEFSFRYASMKGALRKGKI